MWNDDSIKVNSETFDASKYFEVMKTNINIQNIEGLQKQLETIAEQLIFAKKVGQKTLLHKLSFYYSTLLKEQVLLSHGFDKYVLKENVKKFIDEVTPRDTVKIIELDRYPRAIPPENQKDIIRAKELNLFSQFVVVYTDFVDEVKLNKVEKSFVEKNKDPVVFGIFEMEKTGILHDRMYFITDWVDDFCDLDFTKMILEMSNIGIKDPVKKIDVDAKYINELVDEGLRIYDTSEVRKSNMNFWNRIKGIFSNDK